MAKIWDWKTAALNEAKSRKIKRLIKETITHLHGKLPYSYRHRKKGRNAGAHVYLMIKSKFGCTWSKVEDKDALIKYIYWIKMNPC